MAKSPQGASGVRTVLLGTVFFCVLIGLAMAATSFFGLFQLNSTLRQTIDGQVARLSSVEQLGKGITGLRTSEKDLLLSSVLMREDRLAEHQRNLQASAKAISTEIGVLKELSKGMTELERAVLAMEKTQVDLLQHLEEFSGPLAQGKAFSSLDKEYQRFNQDVRDLTFQLTTVKKAALKDVERTREEAASLNLWLLTPVAGGVLLILTLVIAMMRGKRRKAEIGEVLRGISAAGEGRFEKLRIESKNDIGVIARTFNQTIERLEGSIVTEREKEESQTNLINFLEVVSEASDGDLTVKAPVTADAFGSIADAYNLMVESLAELLAETRKKADEVGSESRHLLQIFQQVEHGAEMQMDQVEKATDAVSQTSAATLEIAQKATLAQETSAKVDQVTAQGNARVTRNIDGMQLIRVTVQTINKKMKSLSERLLEIGTISQLISEVATRTTILAMNASIEAARAGEQGRGFLVISDEIKKLADKSADATKQISGIIKAIQTEASEVTAALEEETRTVEEQTRLAKDTGEAFSEIEQAIQEAKGVVAEIFDLSQNQQSLTDRAVQAMSEVSRISNQTTLMIKDSAQISDGLSEMSQSLLTSLSRFRLSEEDLLGMGEPLDLNDEVDEDGETELTAMRI